MSTGHAVTRSFSGLLMPASDEQPAIPPALSDVFLRASEFSWYIRWNGQGAYVGTRDGRKKSALLGLELLEKLLDRLSWEGSPTQLLGLIHGYHGSFSSQNIIAAMGIDGVEGDDESGVQNAGFGSTTLCDQAAARQVLRCIQSAETMIERKLPTLTEYLNITLLSPSKYDGVWSYEPARWNKSEYETHWTCGHIEEFVSPKHDSSNIFRRESQIDWYIRLGERECCVPHSEGMDMLYVLLLHPGDFFSAERICNELGYSPEAARKVMRHERILREFADLMESAKEFVPELMQIHAVIMAEDDFDYELPEDPDALIADLQPVVQKLRLDAKESIAAKILYDSGSTSRLARDDSTGRALAQKMGRCENVIAGLREWQSKDRQAARQARLDLSSPDQRAKVRNALERAIDEIGIRESRVGAYFKKHLRSFKFDFCMDISEHWRLC